MLRSPLGLATLVLLVVAGCAPPPDKISKKFARGALILDVRTPSEFKGDRHPEAVNIPLGQLEGRLGELGNKNRRVIVYCASGVRSARAAKMLKKAGFKNVRNGGGLRDLRKALR